MKTNSRQETPFRLAWVVYLVTMFSPLARDSKAEPCVEVTTEIETAFWTVQGLKAWYLDPPQASKSRVDRVHCLVGKDWWQMGGDFFAQNATITWWFTGTNLIRQIEDALDGAISRQSFESADGNPSKPKRQSDLLELPGRIAWLAFCSGPCLKKVDRHLYPLNNFWKEFMDAPTGFLDHPWCFKDDLGLPEMFTLYTASDQPVVQYRVNSWTNVLGWTFPLEFSLVEYRPAAMTHGMELDFLSKGRVTSIGIIQKPIPPAESKASFQK